jgi:hypothetical protein
MVATKVWSHRCGGSTCICVCAGVVLVEIFCTNTRRVERVTIGYTQACQEKKATKKTKKAVCEKKESRHHTTNTPDHSATPSVTNQYFCVLICVWGTKKIHDGIKCVCVGEHPGANNRGEKKKNHIRRNPRKKKESRHREKAAKRRSRVSGVQDITAHSKTPAYAQMHAQTSTSGEHPTNIRARTTPCPVRKKSLKKQREKKTKRMEHRSTRKHRSV